MTIPDPGDGGTINSIAIGSDGIAILGGSTPSSPLIYKLLQGSAAASVIANANANGGFIASVAIAPDGTAILGGEDTDASVPLIYRVAAGATQATSIGLPNAITGQVNSVAIGSQNVAVLGGVEFSSDAPFVFTVATSGTVAASIAVPNFEPQGLINSVAVYSCDGLYDIKRLRPYYFLQLNETIDALNQAGL